MLEAVGSAPQQEPRAALVSPEPITAFVRIARVKEITGLSKSSILRWIKAGKLCAPVIKDGNSVLWDLAQIMFWRAEQFQKRAEREKA